MVHADNAAVTDVLLAARARVLHDLAARGLDTARDRLGASTRSLSARRWWVEQWPDGAAYVACLVAQDVQEALLRPVGRWPLCSVHERRRRRPHELRVTPDLGEDPHWVCEEGGVVVARLGELGTD